MIRLLIQGVLLLGVLNFYNSELLSVYWLDSFTPTDSYRVVLVCLVCTDCSTACKLLYSDKYDKPVTCCSKLGLYKYTTILHWHRASLPSTSPIEPAWHATSWTWTTYGVSSANCIHSLPHPHDSRWCTTSCIAQSSSKARAELGSFWLLW